ncbi:MAG: DUF4175 family protein [Sandaracinaceae bacterium]|nr:DUF4175 family protein [Sandaracinaceae bacterium]
MTTAPGDLEAYLRRVRFRAGSLVVLRAVGVGLAAGALALALAALGLGPLPQPLVAILAVVASVLMGAALAVRELRRTRALRGAGATQLFAHLSPQLASRAKSVLELTAAPPGASLDLVRAHRAGVERDLQALPLGAVTPLGTWLPVRLLAGVLLVMLASGLTLQTSRGRAGAYALIHAFDQHEPGARRADLVAETQATLRFPAYRARPAETHPGADALQLPHGTTVTYRVRFHSEPSRAALRLPSGEARLTPAVDPPSDGLWYTAEFVASTSGAVEIAIQPSEGDEWAADRRARTLRVLPDAEPVASLAGPEGGADLPLDLPRRIGYAATDDVGVVEVALIIARPDGTDERRVLSRNPANQALPLVQGSAEILPIDLGAQPGDRLTLTLEAQDGDVLTGPHLTRSAPLALRVASAGTRREELLAGLEALFTAALDTLAERLEVPLLRPDRSDATDLARHDHLAQLERGLLSALRTYVMAQPDTGSVYSGHAARLERGMQQEERAYRGRAAGAQRERLDAQQTELLETLVLALDELRAQAHLADAAELARELVALRREIASLLAELRRADTAEARQAIAAAIGRARDRLAQLAQRIAELDPSAVPSDFANRDAATQQEAADALGDLERALGAGDLDAADRHMHELERQIDQLVASLGQAEEDYAEEHFGARDRAMAEALDALEGLETEQRLLAERTDRTRRAAAARALEALRASGDPDTRRVVGELRAAQQALRGVPEGGIGMRDRDTLSRARQRLVDAEDALANGDLGEARRMVAEARADSLGLSRDLELSALMFGGAGGRTADAAAQVSAAARRIAALEGQLDRTIPDLRDHLAADESAQLRDDTTRQQTAESATERLAGQFREGPGGEALSDDAAATLDTVGQQMQEARRSLRRLDALGAGARQAEAAEALRELREELEEQSRGGGGGGGGGAGGGGGGGNSSSQRVAIPTAEDHEGPQAFRRRVLDAMDRRAPGGYEDAARRYYERLLR